MSRRNSGYVGAPRAWRRSIRAAIVHARALARRLMAMGVGRVYPVSLDPAEPNDLNDTAKRVAA